MRAALRVLAALLAALGGTSSACGDGAHDIDYRGEALLVIHGALALTPATATGFEGEDLHRLVRFTVRWAPASWDGPEVLDPRSASERAADVALIAGTTRTFALGLYNTPPAATLHPTATGALALGQVAAWLDRDGDGLPSASEPWLAASRTLVAFTPDGASDPIVATAFGPGFHLLEPSAPCHAAPLRLLAARAGTVPDDDAELIALELDQAFDPQRFFFMPGCPAAVSVATPACPDLLIIRWVCRWGSAPPALCDACEYLAFPEAAPPDTCTAWRDRCVAQGLFSASECEAEHLVCRDGEPARALPCDLACACDKAERRCVADGGATDACAIKRADCLWQAP